MIIKVLLKARRLEYEIREIFKNFIDFILKNIYNDIKNKNKIKYGGNKMKKAMLSLGVITVLGLGGVNNVEARVQPTTDFSTWKEGTTTVVYGSALENDKVNRDLVSKALGVQDLEPSYKEGYVYGKDVAKATGQQFKDSELFSSLRVTKDKEGSGVDVRIDETNGKITNYTAEMYENALISTGINDVDVVVASSHTVTGDSAYGGITKVAELNDITIDENITQTVQEELTTVSGINNDLKGKEGYSQEQLNKAIAEAKTQIAEKGKDKKLTEDEVKEVVNTSIENNGLNNILSGNQINLIVNYFVNAQDSGLFSGENADNIIEGSKNLVNDIKGSDEFKKASEKAKELGADIKDTVASEGFWDSIGNFFKQIFEAIGDLFK